MTETMHQAIFAALCACLGLSASSPEASALIRRAYQEPEPAPAPSRDTDVIFYDIVPDDAPADRYQTTAELTRNTLSEPPRPTVSSFLAFRLHIICYGPRSADHAHRIRSFLYLDGPGHARQLLRSAGIYPVPRPEQPLLLHEEQGSLWRARADLSVSLRVTDTRTDPASRNAIHTAPAITLHR